MLANFKKYMINILLAEDDLDDQHIFKEALDEIEVSFHIANFGNGEALMDYLEEEKDLIPDIIFLDLNMPKMGGFECLNLLRSNPKYNGLFIAIFSTSGYEDNIMRAFSEGADAYIRKPGDFRQLVNSLNELFMTTFGQHFAAANLLKENSAKID